VVLHAELTAIVCDVFFGCHREPYRIEMRLSSRLDHRGLLRIHEDRRAAKLGLDGAALAPGYEQCALQVWPISACEVGTGRGALCPA
jgi:hypothetical protein